MTAFTLREYQYNDFHILLELFYDAVHIGAKPYYNEQQLSAWAPSLNTLSHDYKKTLQEKLLNNHTLILVKNHHEDNIYQDNLDDKQKKIAQIQATEQIIGFGSVYLDEKIDEVIVDHLFVHPQYIGKGCGSALLVELENYALKEWKSKYINTKASIGARLFFASHGYKVLNSNIIERNGINLTNYTMQKLLGY